MTTQQTPRRLSHWFTNQAAVLIVLNAFLLVVLTVLVVPSAPTWAGAPRRAQAGTKPPARATGDTGLPPIREFTVSNIGGTYDVTLDGNAYRATLVGPNLQLHSANYEMRARRILITATKSAARSRYTGEATASGDIVVVVRQPQVQRKNTVTCDTATFTPAPDGTPGRGRVQLRGNVRWELLDPGFDGPVVQTSESGTIDLLGPNKTRIFLSGGTLTGRPIERKSSGGQAPRNR